MPAVEHSFSEPLPVELYVDTDSFIGYLASVEPHHERCERFLQRIERYGGTAIVLSSRVWTEFSHVVMRERFRARLPPDIWRQFDLNHWQRLAVREAYLEPMLTDFEALLRHFETIEIPLTTSVRRRATQYVARHNLGPHDVVHLASATEAGVSTFASLDRGYRRVDGLYLRNDLVHSPAAG